jgi:DNA-binding LacI/PurR family transcriptional regulator
VLFLSIRTDCPTALIMKFEAVTIKDIAKALGLSTSTVSRALRDSYEISPETKKLVLEYAQNNNYRPNPIALSLKEKRSRSIGIIVCEIANSFFSQIINGVESIAYDNGYNVIIAQSHESYEREVLNVQYLASRSIDGLLVTVSSETKDLAHLKGLHDRGFPIVFFDRIVDDMETHKVVVDSMKGAYDATEHLIQRGYKKIANLAGSESLSITKERLSGYRKALADNGHAFTPDYIQHCLHGGMVYEEVEQALDKLFGLEIKPDAILGCADKLTTNCLRYFRKNGIKVPDDVALVGFSNLDLTDLLSPSLTVVRQPAFEMGQLSTELLIQLIESKRPVKDFEKRVLPTQLFTRQSTGS